MDVTLAKPIKPGFIRTGSEVSTDEAVDVQPNGKFARSETVSGDVTPPEILPGSTAQNIKFNVFGDGGIGPKQVKVIVDGHVGEGDVEIALVINYEVASADATEFVGFKEGTTDIPIPE